MVLSQKTNVGIEASRETELVEEFPVHVVTAWLGNTPDVAAKHYLSVLPAHLERAVGCGSPSGGTPVGHTTAVRGCQELTAENDDSSQVPDVAAVDAECHQESISGKSGLVPRRGLEPPTYGFRFVTVSRLPGLSLHHVPYGTKVATV